MKQVSLFLVVAVMVSCVVGHAVIVDPKPINTNPTKTAPCGVATMPTSPLPSATYRAGATVSFTWNLIAGDGGNAIYGKIDPNGGTSFTVDAWSGTKTVGSSLQVYAYDYTLPASITSCPKGVCTLQVKSNTDWVSCYYFNVTSCDDCPLPTPAPAKCKQANKLSFCTAKSNTNVFIAADATATSLDAQAQSTWTNYLNNTAVFANGNDTECKGYFRDFICAVNLPPCAGSNSDFAVGAPCRSMCQRAMDSCQLTELHEKLYDCTALPICPGDSDSSSSLLTPSLLSAAAAVAGAAVLL